MTFLQQYVALSYEKLGVQPRAAAKEGVEEVSERKGAPEVEPV